MNTLKCNIANTGFVFHLRLVVCVAFMFSPPFSVITQNFAHLELPQSLLTRNSTFGLLVFLPT